MGVRKPTGRQTEKSGSEPEVSDLKIYYRHSFMIEDIFSDKNFQYLVRETRNRGVGNKFSGNPTAGRRTRWTQEAIGDVTGNDQRTIRAWEKSEVWPDQDKVQQFIARLETAPGRGADLRLLLEDERRLLDALWGAYMKRRGADQIRPKSGVEQGEVGSSGTNPGSTQIGSSDVVGSTISSRLSSIWERAHWPAITGLAAVVAVIIAIFQVYFEDTIQKSVKPEVADTQTTPRQSETSGACSPIINSSEGVSVYVDCDTVDD